MGSFQDSRCSNAMLALHLTLLDTGDLQVLHVAFALWAYSLFGVGQSPLVTGLFARLVHLACTTTEAGWLAVSGIDHAQLAQRLLSADAAHLLIVVVVMVGVLFLKLTLTRWIQVCTRPTCLWSLCASWSLLLVAGTDQPAGT